MERRNKVRSRLSLGMAIALTGALFYSMLTWIPASAADRAVTATFAGGFNPDPIVVAPGDTIVWTNGDSAAIGDHNLVADSQLPPLDEGFSGECTIAPGQTCSAEVTSNPLPMNYGYSCTIHTTMQGTIEVDPDAEDPEETASPTSSASASSSPSSSASPSTSPSTSPSASSSPTPSASPSPSPSPEPTDVVRTVSLGLRKHLKAKGRVQGQGPGANACIDDVKVMIQKKKRKKGWKPVKNTRTGPDGKYSVKIRDKRGKYRAKIGPETRSVDLVVCGGAKSDRVTHKHRRRR